jgi:outer membrane protein OmpA-like peptidoglycan-associated protein
MIKKASLLLLLLLAGLPSCGRKKATCAKKTPMTQQEMDDFKNMNLALADGNLEVDESMLNYLNDMNELVSFADEGDFNLEQAQVDMVAGTTTGEHALSPVYFGYDKDKADAAERAKIKNTVSKAKDMLAQAGPKAKLVVEGHACLYGTDAYDMALSERRAKGVSDQLVSAGVSRESIKIVGRGKEIPIVKEGSREEQWPNRRVEFHIVG